MVTKIKTTSEVWFEIQYSIKGADCWLPTNQSATTLDSAKRKISDGSCGSSSAHEFRIVKVTRAEEVV